MGCSGARLERAQSGEFLWRRVRCLFYRRTHAQGPAGALFGLLHGDAGMHGNKRELFRFLVWTKNAKVGNHCRGSAAAGTATRTRLASIKEAGGRNEVERVDEGSPALLDDDQHFLSAGRDFGRSAGTRQTYTWFAVGADNGGVDICEAIDLRCAQKADINASTLEPI